ncbi:MAG: hypothetical protein WAM91_06730 [Candidatus Acidiferrales bacterium]
MAPGTPTTPEALAAFIVTSTGALLAELTAKLVEFVQPGQREPQSIAALARPRTLSALYCLAARVLGNGANAARAGSGASGGSSTAAVASQFPAYLTATRQELKRLHPDWKGPFTFESTVQQGVGLYLRNAPNLTELVRSKPDYVFAEELDRVEASGDRLAIFALKAKIQFLEAMRIRTHEPAYLPLDSVIESFLRRAADSLAKMQPEYSGL